MSAVSTLDPNAESFTPAQQDSPDKNSAKQTPRTAPKPIEEGDIGCFLCDDGLWCPMCSPDEDVAPEPREPETPVVAKRELEPEQSFKTPGDERETLKWSTAAGSAGESMK